MTCLKSSKPSLVGSESKLVFLLANAEGILNGTRDSCGTYNLRNENLGC